MPVACAVGLEHKKIELMVDYLNYYQNVFKDLIFKAHLHQYHYFAKRDRGFAEVILTY